MTSLPPQQCFDDEEPTGVVGTLREMPVAEIVQTLAGSRKDALIEVKPRGEAMGVLGIENGRVTYARQGNVLGEEAFFQLFSAVRGAFRIRYGRKPEQHNIDRDVTWLVLEGARILDEQRGLLAVTPVQPPASSASASLDGELSDGWLDAPPTNAEGNKVEPNSWLDAPAEITFAPASKATPAGSIESAVRGLEASLTSGTFASFFDEAGVVTPVPVPLPEATQRFASLKLVDLPELAIPDDRADTDRTTVERRRAPQEFLDFSDVRDQLRDDSDDA